MPVEYLLCPLRIYVTHESVVCVQSHRGSRHGPERTALPPSSYLCSGVCTCLLQCVLTTLGFKSATNEQNEIECSQHEACEYELLASIFCDQGKKCRALFSKLLSRKICLLTA